MNLRVINSFIIFFVVLAMLLGIVFYFTNTSQGFSRIIRRQLIKATGASGVTFGSFKGNLFKGVLLRNIRLSGVPVSGQKLTILADSATVYAFWNKTAFAHTFQTEALSIEPN